MPVGLLDSHDEAVAIDCLPLLIDVANGLSVFGENCLHLGDQYAIFICLTYEFAFLVKDLGFFHNYSDNVAVVIISLFLQSQIKGKNIVILISYWTVFSCFSYFLSIKAHDFVVCVEMPNNLVKLVVDW